MKVVQFQRPANKSYFSMERVFASVRSAMAGAEIAVRVCPFESRGIFKRLGNIVDAAFRQGDVNHITGDVHYLALLLRKNRTVLTIHDCRGMVWESGLRRRFFYWGWLKMPVARSAVVTVVSEQTRQEVLHYTSCAEGKVRVIPNPVGSEFQPAPKVFRSEKPTILQIGASKNKNIERLALALSGLNCRLDVIGPLSADAQRQLEQAGVEYECAANLSDAEVAAKYRNADLIAFCSTYEGFGMPIIEAQAVGRPVVTSNIAPMSEVAGGAACLVDPYDVESMRRGILRVIEEPAYREDLIQRGFENVKRYSPEEIGQRYLKLYKEVMRSRCVAMEAERATANVGDRCD
jgi:glycosyltransferase involved in cell wall biosynthesis